MKGNDTGADAEYRASATGQEMTYPQERGKPHDMMTDRAYLGVEGLDAMLPAGLSYNSQIMLRGDTGVGKSVLAGQFLYEGLLVGDTCIYISCDDTPDAMRENLRLFRLGSRAYEDAGRLIFVDAYSQAETPEKHWIPEPAVLDEFYLYEKEILERCRGARIRLVVDSLSTILLQNDPYEIIAFNATRLKLLRRLGVLTLDSYVNDVLDDRTVASLAHAYPIIIRMNFEEVEGGGLRRVVQMGKMKSGEFQANKAPFTIDPSTGIVVQSA